MFQSFKADALNLHLLQVIAVFVLFMGSLPLLGAFFYANDEDKRQIFFGRLVVGVPYIQLTENRDSLTYSPLLVFKI